MDTPIIRPGDTVALGFPEEIISALGGPAKVFDDLAELYAGVKFHLYQTGEPTPRVLFIYRPG